MRDDDGFVRTVQACNWNPLWTSWHVQSGAMDNGTKWEVDPRVYWPLVLLEQSVLLFFGGAFLTWFLRRERRRHFMRGGD